MEKNRLSGLMNKLRRDRFAIVLSMAVTLIYLWAFFNQARYSATDTDTAVHLQYVRNLLLYTGHLPTLQRGYPLFFYIIALFVLIFRNYTFAALLFVTIWSFGTNFLQISFTRYFLDREYKDAGMGIYASLAGTAMSFVWPMTTGLLKTVTAYDQFFSSLLHVYLRSGATAEYHNLTYLCLKPFALATVFYFIRYIDENRQGSLRDIIGFGCSFLLSALAKPSFYQCFAPAGVIIVLALFIKRGKGFWGNCIRLAVAFIPATIWVIYSMTLSIYPMAFAPLEAIRCYDDGVPIPVVLLRGIVYAIWIIICMILSRYNDDLIWIGGFTYLFGTLEWLLLDLPDDSSSLPLLGGYNISMWIFFILAIIVAGRLYMRNGKKSSFAIGNVLLGIHGLTGVLVFVLFWVDSYLVYFGLK